MLALAPGEGHLPGFQQIMMPLITEQTEQRIHWGGERESQTDYLETLLGFSLPPACFSYKLGAGGFNTFLVNIFLASYPTPQQLQPW